MSTFVAVIFTLIIYGVVFALVWYAVNYLITNAPIPDPFGRWILILMVILACFIIIDILLQLVGGGGFLHVPLLRWHG